MGLLLLTAWQIRTAGSDSYAITRGDDRVSRAAFFTALVDDRSLQDTLTATLRAAPFTAFAWETPALSDQTAAFDATFAIVDNPALARVTADPSPFAAQLATTDRIATFANLGGDAVLIVPSPRAAPDAPHLAAFVRSAEPDVIAELWSAVGAAVARRRGAKPVWVSTAGLGVSWLHVRLDDRPKYYRHRAFTSPTT